MAPRPAFLGSPTTSSSTSFDSPPSPRYFTSSRSTPLAPPSPTPVPLPAPRDHNDDYAHIVRSLQRRLTDRVSLAAALAASPHRNSTTGVAGGTGGGGEQLTTLPALEADLRLAAQIGQTLLADKTALQGRLDAAEKAKGKLLDRLASSVKENQALQRRLEETVATLENADASNRALLVSLEEDRKTISRLSSDAGRSVQAQTALSHLQRAHDDTRQELAAERKRADAAEAKARKLGERAQELEVRLGRATADLAEMRQDKVLNARRSLDALNRARAAAGPLRGSGAPAPLTSPADQDAVDGDTLVAAAAQSPAQAVLSDNPEAKELLRMVETLARENTLLRSESLELRNLLDDSRDQQSDLRSAMAAARNDILPQEDEAAGPDREASRERRPPSRRRESIASSGARSTNAGGAPSALPEEEEEEGATDAGTFPSWTSGTSLSHSVRAGDLSRTLSAGSSSHWSDAAPLQGQGRRIGVGSRPPPVTSASTGVLGSATRRSTGTGGQTAGGRGHTRRAMSMDVTPQIKSFTSSAPNSPRNNQNSPSARPASIFSNANEEMEPRPRRHHRPLSLSLGPSVFPLVPEDGHDGRPVSPFTRTSGTGPHLTHRRRSSQAPSLTGLGLGLASPRPITRPRRSRSPERAEAATQTSPPPRRAPSPPTILSPSPSPSTPTTPRSRRASQSPSPRLGPAPSSTASVHSLDASLPAPSFLTDSTPGDRPGPVEQRTAALGQLIEHIGKLLNRVQGADIATQEKRLRKQNLPGDVRHLAQANLRDLVHEIDQLRAHFRKVVELERAAQARAPSSPGSAAASQVDRSLVTRRDFVSLVKLVRDLLFETSRLRMLVNRVQLDPPLASSLKELDVPDAFDTLDAQRSRTGPGAQPASASSAATVSAGGLLAPLSRLFGSAADAPTTVEQSAGSLSHKASSAQLRPPLGKRGGSSTVSTATVNVEFGSGTVRQAESGGGASAGPAPPPSSSQGSPASATTPTSRSTGRSASRPRQAQVRRDLANIFAGAPTRSHGPGGAEPLPVALGASVGATPIPQPHPTHPTSRLAASAAFSSAASFIPFGRLLSSYRPALSSTTNAVLDSLPHGGGSLHRSLAGSSGGPKGGPDRLDERGPTLLERQLRPRGLSDSSIRSTFIAHANPHHRLVTAAGLALSAEPARVSASASAGTGPAPAAMGRATTTSGWSDSPASAAPAAAAIDTLREQLSDLHAASVVGGDSLSHSAATGASLGVGGGSGSRSVSRRPSAAQLRARVASSSSSSLSPPPVPPLPLLPPVVTTTTLSAGTSESSLSRSLSRSGPLPLASSSPSSSPLTAAAGAGPQPISISVSPSHGHVRGGGIDMRSGSPLTGPGTGTGTWTETSTGLLGSLASSALGSLAKQATGAGRDDWKERGRMG